MPGATHRTIVAIRFGRVACLVVVTVDQDELLALGRDGSVKVVHDFCSPCSQYEGLVPGPPKFRVDRAGIATRAQCDYRSATARPGDFRTHRTALARQSSPRPLEIRRRRADCIEQSVANVHQGTKFLPLRRACNSAAPCRLSLSISSNRSSKCATDCSRRLRTPATCSLVRPVSLTSYDQRRRSVDMERVKLQPASVAEEQASASQTLPACCQHRMVCHVRVSRLRTRWH